MATESNGLTVRRVPLADLHLDPANARSHGPANMDAIAGSLRRFGQAEPLVVQKGTGRIIGGNGRYRAMQELGWAECDVVEVDLEGVEATALGIALNRTADLAEWDDPALARLLEELRAEDALDGVGYSGAEIDELLAQVQAALGPGDAEAPEPEPPQLQAVSRPGDLWVLGRHRLLCGDSSDPDAVDRLLAGAPVHLVNMDPPYNVRVEPRSNNAIAAGLSSFGASRQPHPDVAGHPQSRRPTGKMRAKDRPLTNDYISPEEFDRLLRAWSSPRPSSGSRSTPS